MNDINKLRDDATNPSECNYTTINKAPIVKEEATPTVTWISE